MTILGSIYLMDANHIETTKHNLAIYFPPKAGPGPNRILCMDMDETSDELEQMFPDKAMKATLLCPPPLAMYKEIDGDQEGFIQAYNEYLEYDDSVQEFIATMLYFMHIGGNILLNIPSYLEDEPIWVHTLMMFFYTRYGISMGIMDQSYFAYDDKYDDIIITLLYQKKMIDVFDFINCNTNPYPTFPPILYNQIVDDLMVFSGPDNDPMKLYTIMKEAYITTGIPITKPVIYFDQY